MKRKAFNWIPATIFLLAGAVIWMIPGMKFSAFFCVGIAFMCVVGKLLRLWEKKARIGKICKVIFQYGVACGLVLLILLEIQLVKCGNEDHTAFPADAVIVLGAGVNGETPSLALQSRIEAAREYLDAHPDVPVVLSGGQGPGEDISEAEAMHRALKEDSEASFILEDRSTNTAENFAFSKELLLERGIDPETALIAVVTNDFHVMRACLLAQRQGYGGVYGVGTPIPWWWLEANYYLREAFAMVKAAILYL